MRKHLVSSNRIRLYTNRFLMNNSKNAKPKQIFFVIRYFHPFVGGLEKNTLNLAAALVRRGRRVVVITSRFALAWPRHDMLLGVPVVRLASPDVKFIGGCLFLAGLAWHLGRQRHCYGLLHAFQVGYTAGWSILLGKMLGRPTVLTLASSGSGGDIQRHARTVWGRLFLALCRRAERIVVLNKAMGCELAGIGYPEDRIAPAGNGVDMEFYKKSADKGALRSDLGFDDTEKLVLYAGRLSPEKGVDFLIQSCARLNSSIQTKLLIAGDGPEKKRLQEIARTAGLADRIFWCGSIDNVLPYLQAADLFVMPSRFEGLSNALLEAMACELPVIATDVTGNNELITHGDNGLLVAHGDEAALAAAMQAVLENPRMGRELASRAHDYVRQHHSLDTVIARYETLYASLETLRGQPA
jgi:glycosyltransferase involved in cell wall biosynthesis